MSVDMTMKFTFEFGSFTRSIGIYTESNIFRILILHLIYIILSLY